ncbi:2-octaprenyl-6-methoxyphenyl hydroxylase [Alkalilimnicola ehrlichii]|uniref:2-octaprenyl-6-methoxyphenyl hydroxylase n=1 Tax=Alkalilimnicola ehrlichii TaxID=351052 RepID=UPI003B9E9F0D
MSGRYDVIIAGGGLVGGCLAVALGQTGLRVAVLEAVTPEAPVQPSYDDRTTALSPVSRRILEALDLWPDLEGEITPIREIHISEQGGFGYARLRADREGVPALGYLVPNRRFGQVLPQRLRQQPGLDYLTPARAVATRTTPGGIEVTIEDDEGRRRPLQARLAVAADGTHSALRELWDLPLQTHDYGSHAVIANLTPEEDHRGRAFERFTPDGPMALLPTTGGRCALVWSVADAELDQLLALDDAAFLVQVQRRFGYRLGRLRQVGRRGHYPLRGHRVTQPLAPRGVVIGNAAHTMHPVAGQGLNLALRDIAWLAQLLAEAERAGEDVGHPALLQRYARQRQADTRLIMGFTHLLLGSFGNRLPGLRAGRNLALKWLDVLPPARRAFMRLGMGLGAPLPALAAGCPLNREERR